MADSKRFEAYLDRMIAEYRIPGIAVSVTSRNGDVLYETFKGYRSVEDQLPVTQDTIFGMASLTKSFTAICTLQLHERGVIDINKPIADYFPEIEDRRILVWHLLSHCAGFYPIKRLLMSDVASEMGIFADGTVELAFSKELAEEGRRRIVSTFNSEAQRLGSPGEILSYCNDGFGILSELIRVYGDKPSYAEYLRAHVLEPLGMRRSGCEFLKPFTDENCATLYYTKGQERMHCRDFYDSAFVLNGGGAMRSTISDMRRYLHALMNQETLLSGPGYELLKRPRVAYTYGSQYAAGLAVARVGNDRLLMHSGGLTGVSSYLAWLESAGIGVLVFCNLTGVPVKAAAHAALTTFADVPLWPEGEHRAPEPAVAVSDDIIGVYSSRESSLILEICRKENGAVGMKAGETEYDCFLLEPDAIIIRNALYDSDAVIVRKDGNVLGVRYGGRVYRKEGKNPRA